MYFKASPQEAGVNGKGSNYMIGRLEVEILLLPGVCFRCFLFCFTGPICKWEVITVAHMVGIRGIKYHFVHGINCLKDFDHTGCPRKISTVFEKILKISNQE